jgi:uncharacterized protein (TIGR02145 family)
MKKLFTLLALIVLTTINAQAPQGFNYQATVRNSSGALIINQNVLFKFNIMLNSQTSLPVYSETHQAPTDDLGQVNLTIGIGTPTVGTFSSINWGSGSYFLGIELNTGSGYIAMGTTQLLSVPYALYANSAGGLIGNSIILPIVTTNDVSNLTMLSVTLSASTSNTNQIIQRGFAYSTNPYPTRTQGSFIVDNATLFEYNINNLDFLLPHNTTYYVRAYVVTENEVVVYGNQISFTTLSFYQNGNGAIDVEGNQYPSILLNGQEWMQNNLTVSRYRNGDIIPEVTDAAEWSNLTTGAWRYIADDPAYGKLYNWYAVNDLRGLAPLGWHVSTNSEWSNLTTYLGGIDNAGDKMKGGTWRMVGPSGLYNQYSNLSGLNALPGNRVNNIGESDCTAIQIIYSPYSINCISSSTGAEFGYWWSSSSSDTTNANFIGLNYVIGSAVLLDSSSKKLGYSVRCVKD